MLTIRNSLQLSGILAWRTIPNPNPPPKNQIQILGKLTLAYGCLTLPLSHSLTLSLPRSLTLSLSHPLTRSLSHSLTLSRVHSLSLSHSLTLSLVHSLSLSDALFRTAGILLVSQFSHSLPFLLAFVIAPPPHSEITCSAHIVVTTACLTRALRRSYMYMYLRHMPTLGSYEGGVHIREVPV